MGYIAWLVLILIVWSILMADAVGRGIPIFDVVFINVVLVVSGAVLFRAVRHGW